MAGSLSRGGGVLGGLLCAHVELPQTFSFFFPPHCPFSLSLLCLDAFSPVVTCHQKDNGRAGIVQQYYRQVSRIQWCATTQKGISTEGKAIPCQRSSCSWSPRDGPISGRCGDSNEPNELRQKRVPELHQPLHYKLVGGKINKHGDEGVSDREANTKLRRYGAGVGVQQHDAELSKLVLHMLQGH